MASNGNGNDPWDKRARTIATVWGAVRAPLCWLLGAGLTVFEVVRSASGAQIDPLIVTLIGGLLGLPFFFVNRDKQ